MVVPAGNCEAPLSQPRTSPAMCARRVLPALDWQIDRWKAAIDAEIALDLAADPAVYPGQGGQSRDFDANVANFKNSVVPNQIRAFRKAVSCGDGGTQFPKDSWDDALYTCALAILVCTPSLGRSVLPHALA